jgi:uncharacterized protein YacL
LYCLLQELNVQNGRPQKGIEMDVLIGVALVIAALAAVAYTRRKIPAFTDSQRKASLTQMILAVVGIAFGITASFYVTQTLQKIIFFIAAFGIVHVPAAIILLIKEKRGEGRS